MKLNIKQEMNEFTDPRNWTAILLALVSRAAATKTLPGYAGDLITFGATGVLSGMILKDRKSVDVARGVGMAFGLQSILVRAVTALFKSETDAKKKKTYFEVLGYLSPETAATLIPAASNTYSGGDVTAVVKTGVPERAELPSTVREALENHRMRH